MDIAKYIGLFLLKNQYCYIHGLGNMELKKRPATYDGKALQAPSWDVVVTQGGSIDDNLANFIATSEQISISKAANTLREYSMQARKELAEGTVVPVPGIGHFVEKDGHVSFVTDEHFSYKPAGVPTVRNSRQLEEQLSKPVHKPSYPAATKASATNWSNVVLLVVLAIVVGGGVWGIWYYTGQNKQTPAPVPAPAVVTNTVAATPPPADTTHTKTDTAHTVAAVAVSDSLQVSQFRIVIGNYRTKDRADKRVETLTKNGNKVEMVMKDSTNFLVVTTINCRAADTTHVIDSLKRLFGFKGTVTYKP